MNLEVADQDLHEAENQDVEEVHHTITIQTASADVAVVDQKAVHEVK